MGAGVRGVGRAVGGRWEGVRRALRGRWVGVGLASGEGRPGSLIYTRYIVAGIF